MQTTQLNNNFFLSLIALQKWNELMGTNCSNPVTPTKDADIEILVELDREFPQQRSDFIFSDGKYYDPNAIPVRWNEPSKAITPVFYAPLGTAIRTTIVTLKKRGKMDLYDVGNKCWQGSMLVKKGTNVEIPIGTFCTEPEIDGIVNNFWIEKKTFFQIAFWIDPISKHIVRFQPSVDTFVIPRNVGVTYNGVSLFWTANAINVTIKFDYSVEPPHNLINPNVLNLSTIPPNFRWLQF
jgi:hypothetical protein